MLSFSLQPNIHASSSWKKTAKNRPALTSHRWRLIILSLFLARAASNHLARGDIIIKKKKTTSYRQVLR